ncbi:hypothetical protein IAR55_007120 [Kwoniella newhampshirensis]|uniref:Cytoplasmic protein n=1 Tax=Kwoniella newhampshirensis TaxID=1651941 RepID=A0AAW0YQA7_9TREE
MDFGSLPGMSGKSSMRRKSLLQALGKQPSSSSASSSSHSHRQSALPLPLSLPSSYPHSHPHNSSSSAPSSTYSTPQTASTAHFPLGISGGGDGSNEVYSPASNSEYDHMSFTSTSRTISNVYGTGTGSGHGGSSRSTSANHVLRDKSASATKEGDKMGSGSAAGGAGMIRRPEDLFRVVRERMLGWSYMMEWYQGDTHWLNSVRIPPSSIEQALGPKHLETRARNFYVLGVSLSAMFDIPSAGDYLKASIKLLDEWESWAEGSGGSKGVKNLFRGQKSARKVTGTGSMVSEFAAMGFDGSESYLLNVNMPFIPDFFQVHSSTCSIIRDIYKKLLGMFLPLPATSTLPSVHTGSLLHPSTIIHSAPLEAPFNNPKSPGASSVLSTATFPNQPQPGYGSGNGVTSPTYNSVIDNLGTIGSGTAFGAGYDALQALIAGDLPNDRTLIGDGQKLTPQVVELFVKMDTKLKKHFSILIREGDTLARKMLDDELASLLNTLNPGTKPLHFDLGSATHMGRMGRSEEEERRERDFGTI